MRTSLIQSAAVMSFLCVCPAAAQNSALDSQPIPTRLKEAFASLHTYQQQGDRAAATRAYAQFASQLSADTTGLAYYGLAVTLRAAQFIRPESHLGGTASHAAVRAAIRALELDAGIPGIMAVLADLPPADVSESQYRTIASLLKSCCATSSATQTALSTLANLSFIRSSYEDTRWAVDQLMHRGDSSSAFRYLVLLAAARGARDSVEYYYHNALELATTTTYAAALARDIESLRQVYPARDSLRDFWLKEAKGSGITWLNGVAEYYGRLAHAVRRYGFEGIGARVSPFTFPKGGFSLDDRGHILLRYGHPDEVLRPRGGTFRQAEAWIYRAPTRSFLFVAFPGSPGLQLTPDQTAVIAWERFRSGLSGLDQVEEEAAASLAGEQVWLDLANWFAEIARRESRYASMIARTSAVHASARRLLGGSDAQLRDFQISAHVLQSLTRQDLHDALDGPAQLRPRYSVPLISVAEVYRFRDEDMNAQLFIAAAVQSPSRAIAVRSRLGIDGDFAQDTSVRMPANVTGRILQKAVTIPSGLRHWTLNLTANDSSGAVFSGTKLIPQFTGFDISDIVLSYYVKDEQQRSRFAAVPGLKIRSNRDFIVSYEIYGASEGKYKVNIRIDPAAGFSERLKKMFGAGRTSMVLSYEADATGALIMPVRQRIAANLVPGPYVFRIIVTQNDRVTSAERRVNVEDE